LSFSSLPRQNEEPESAQTTLPFELLESICWNEGSGTQCRFFLLQVPVKVAAVKSAGRLASHQVQAGGQPSLQELLPIVAALLADEASDVRKEALASLKSIAKVGTVFLRLRATCFRLGVSFSL
jgi:hypothetical protein